MEPGLDDLGISQPTQRQKMLNLKDALSEKNTLKKSPGFAQFFLNDFEKTKGQSTQSHQQLFGEINDVTHRSFQSSRKKLKIESYLGKFSG